MKAADYKELRVYRLAVDAAMEIFESSRSWPAEEKYSLTDQTKMMHGAASWCSAGRELRETPPESIVGTPEREERQSVRASTREESVPRYTLPRFTLARFTLHESQRSTLDEPTLHEPTLHEPTLHEPTLHEPTLLTLHDLCSAAS